MKRILFFVHYNKYDDLADYVIYLLDNIRIIFNKIIIISNSKLNDQHKIKLKELCDLLIIRENTGFDFGAWKDALLQEGWENLSAYDNVTLMNDSCFGPLFDMTMIYNRMEQINTDFWGISEHTEMSYGLQGTDDPIPEHIQSYFICFKNKIIIDRVFQNFWENLNYEKNIKIVIQKYESQLTPILKKNGFNYSVIVNSTDKISISFTRPDLCIINQAPFIKIKSFFFYSNTSYIKQLIIEKTNYPVSLINNYFSDLYDPTNSYKTDNKTINPELYTINNNNSYSKTAIHIIADNPVILQKYISFFDKFEIDYHLYITTDSENKKREIIDFMRNNLSYKYLKEIIVYKYNNRNILPFLNMAEKLKNYDIAGNIYINNNIDEIQNYFEFILTHIYKIINIINSNKKIGIIIPDIPEFLLLKLIKDPKEKKMKYNMNKLWKQLKLKKDVDFLDLSTLIFPYNNMFWYRPAALSPLTEFYIQNTNIFKNHFINNNLSLECYGKMIVYIAWSEGYDYRIITSGIAEESIFYYNHIINNYIKKYLSLHDYKTGNLLLFLNRFAKKIKRKLTKIYK